LEKADGTVKVWKLDKTYEDELMRCLGEKKYIKLCTKYSTKSKPIKQRLIACDSESKVPCFIDPIIK
jgi:hypothetical protein